MLFRKATIEDIDELYDMLIAVIDGMEHKEWLSLDDKEDFVTCLQDGGSIFLYCDDFTGEILATVQVVVDEYSRGVLGKHTGSEKINVIGACAVAEKARGSNLQFQLLQMAELAYGTGTYVVSVHSDNIFSKRNFEQCGYIKVAHATGIWGSYERDILKHVIT